MFQLYSHCKKDFICVRFVSTGLRKQKLEKTYCPQIQSCQKVFWKRALDENIRHQSFIQIALVRPHFLLLVTAKWQRDFYLASNISLNPLRTQLVAIRNNTRIRPIDLYTHSIKQRE